MNLPFVEQRVVSVEIIEGGLVWVELSKIGAAITLVEKGSLPWGVTPKERLESLEQLTQAIHGDTFAVTVSSSEAVIEVLSEEVPYFEEPEEVDRWIEGRKLELVEAQNSEVILSHHLVALDEEVNRVLIQVASAESLSELEELFAQANLPITHLYSGVSECGYSQLLNPEVSGELHSVLHSNSSQAFLASYESGLLVQLHCYEIEEDLSSDYSLDRAHALIQSEELNHQLEAGSTTLFLPESRLPDYPKRTIQAITPHNGKKAFEAGSIEYSTSLGAGVKSLYPGLDEFEFISGETKAQSLELQDKLTFKKVAVLLLAPLVLLWLGVYVWSAITTHTLSETSQVMSAIEDKVSLVQERRDVVQALFSDYKDLQEVAGRETNSAKAFSVINGAISRQVTLEKILVTVKPESTLAEVTITGVAEEERYISSFINALSEHSWARIPKLLSSTAQKDGQGAGFVISVEVDVE